MTSSPLNSYTADGNGVMAQPAEGVWQCLETHICLEQNPWMITNEMLYIGISNTAVLLFMILAVKL